MVCSTILVLNFSCAICTQEVDEEENLFIVILIILLYVMLNSILSLSLLFCDLSSCTLRTYVCLSVCSLVLVYACVGLLRINFRQQACEF